MDVKGKCLLTGLPKSITITSEETLEALSEPVIAIIDAVHSVLERTPPELVGDISSNGIY
jgi:rod shape-determining protein MreB